MAEQLHPSLVTAAELADTQLFAARLGEAEELTTLGPLALCGELHKIHSLPALRDFLIEYQEKHLAPRELPAIAKAFDFASHFKVRELVALDQAIAAEPAFRPFLVASHHVGRRQLNKLRALQDDRLVQRYRQAVLNGEANAWHTLVYGLILQVYSIPLRQGLAHYATQTLRGFIYAASKPLDLTQGCCMKLLHDRLPEIGPAVDAVMPPEANLFRVAAR